jgi:hypothetical protein
MIITPSSGGAFLREGSHRLPLRVRRIYRVRFHVDLSILAQLARALIKSRE